MRQTVICLPINKIIFRTIGLIKINAIGKYAARLAYNKNIFINLSASFSDNFPFFHISGYYLKQRMWMIFFDFPNNLKFLYIPAF